MNEYLFCESNHAFINANFCCPRIIITSCPFVFNFCFNALSIVAIMLFSSAFSSNNLSVCPPAVGIIVTFFVISIVFASFAASPSFLPRAIMVSSSSSVLSRMATSNEKSSILVSSECMSTLFLAHSTRKLVSARIVFIVSEPSYD